MVQANEILTAFFGLPVVLFLFIYRDKFKVIPRVHLLVTGYFLLYIGLLVTIAEGFFWSDFMNVLEHLLYCVSTLFLTCWVWLAFKRERKNV
ncbi:hypothetical protein [Pseudodesulfovibrio sediminis]|uniref:Uncharacterized protein n=1 Tax=Pseudodesulfovibrio sediminis TaxID=2810563 RepID=A0ABM8I2R2_9BACT|nr:hypothetical protein [Pseudodesulfovibrio sediminis]BCS88086.1 hypothetical protein PSDVSF_13280 [Pseudodesulfovibrio sediminis]